MPHYFPQAGSLHTHTHYAWEVHVCLHTYTLVLDWGYEELKMGGITNMHLGMTLNIIDSALTRPFIAQRARKQDA